MVSFSSRIWHFVWWGVLILFLFILPAVLIINTTRSMPLGLYFRVNAPIRDEALVLYRPDQNEPRQLLGLTRGYDHGGMPLIKRVAASQGDVVSVTDEGVWINGRLSQFSEPQNHDRRGEPLSKADLTNYTLKQDQVLLLGETQSSWDSRYFGVVRLDRCEGVIQPLLTWR
jgi:conjugative transfer signal peptidase TraF